MTSRCILVSKYKKVSKRPKRPTSNVVCKRTPTTKKSYVATIATRTTTVSRSKEERIGKVLKL